jgi:4-amino-4-deoxy-L-arabinose transferase-like glycosyltransferase
VTLDRRTILALFSIAFGLRVLYAVLVGTNPEINPNPYTHEFLMARKIAMGADWWSQPISPLAPGYEFMLAALFKVFYVNRWLVVLTQAVFGGITAFLLYRIGEKCLQRGVGLLSALWFSIYVHHMHLTSVMVRDVTVTLLLVYLCYLLVRFSTRARGVVWAALSYAFLVHFDPQFLFFLPFVALYVLLGATRHRLLNAQYAFLFLATVLVLLVPWTIRNYRVYGEPIPVALEATKYVQPFKNALGEGTDEKTAGQRSGFWSNTVELWRITNVKGDTQTDTGGRTRTVPAWSLRHNLISIVNYGLLLPFFLLGIWRSVRGRNQTGLVLSAVVVGYYLIRAIYGGSERARLPIEPLIILLAFYAIVELYGRFRGSRASAEAESDGG